MTTTNRKGIHAANPDRSEGLQAIMRVLEGGGWYSAREIREASKGEVEAVSARIQELKANGISIECKHIDGQYRYRLTGLIEKGESTSINLYNGSQSNRPEKGDGNEMSRHRTLDSLAPPLLDEMEDGRTWNFVNEKKGKKEQGVLF